MAEGLTGGCLCGAVRYEVSAPPIVVGHCYCTDCRKSSGTSHCTHAAVPQGAFTVSGEVRFFDRPTDSGNIVGRGFCPACGSAVYSRNSGMPGMAFIRTSSLDDPDTVTPTVTVYASRAPSWAKIDDAQPVFPEMMQGGPRAAME